jgi:hypothetical protein
MISFTGTTTTAGPKQSSSSSRSWRKKVKDIVTLLETCTCILLFICIFIQGEPFSPFTFSFFLPTVDGALTLAQLDYNLPERPGFTLCEMVQLLAAAGLLQKEEINHGHQQQQQKEQQPRYCVNTGLPRTQVTTQPPARHVEHSRQRSRMQSTMVDTPSTSSEVNATVGAVEVRMEDAPTKMDAEKTTEVPNASKKAVEKPVEATDTAPICGCHDLFCCTRSNQDDF